MISSSPKVPDGTNVSSKVGKKKSVRGPWRASCAETLNEAVGALMPSVSTLSLTKKGMSNSPKDSKKINVSSEVQSNVAKKTSVRGTSDARPCRASCRETLNEDVNALLPRVRTISLTKEEISRFARDYQKINVFSKVQSNVAKKSSVRGTLYDGQKMLHSKKLDENVNEMVPRSLSFKKETNYLCTRQGKVKKDDKYAQETTDETKIEYSGETKNKWKDKHRHIKRKDKHRHINRDEKTMEDFLDAVETDEAVSDIENMEPLYFTKEIIDHLPEITSNIIKGPFRSVEHYIDIQFKLLRHDLIEPFRDGIFILANSDKLEKVPKVTQLNVYKNAQFLRYDMTKNKLGILVQFDPNRSMSNGSNFFYGSLVAFTKDNFQNYFFATVLNYNTKGKVTVKLCDDDDDIQKQNLQADKFTMVESEVFYAPYFHVMKALQSLSGDNFPMKNYIVDVDCKSRPPAYLSNKIVKYEIGCKSNVPVLDLSSEAWPNAEELDMDASQYAAFRSALTQEFVVVQGPPGTGKTYLGLKVAQVLINNAHVRNSNNRPILVVCFTNHALDQFLEGMLSFTEELTRVGGQSKNEVLLPYNLKNKKKEMHFWGFTSVRREIEDKLSRYCKMLQLIDSDLTHIKLNLGVISFSYLERIIDYQQAKCFSTHSIVKSDEMCTQDSMFITWLFSETDLNDSYMCEYITEEMLDINIEYEDEQVTYPNYQPLKYSVTLANLRNRLTTINENINKTLTSPGEIDEIDVTLWLLKEHYSKILRDLEALNTFLCTNTRGSTEQISQLLLQTDLWQLNCHERRMLYNHWVDQAVCNLKSLQNYVLQKLKVEERNHEYAQTMDNADLLKTSLIIGMTTTGAARNQPLLQRLKPKIVIVEEAAEVLESHIIASLTCFCEHLILIGDHMQLRPNINVHELRMKYGFDISLFERMLNNGLHSDVLNVQHRMRPEIACLITPSIYPKLHNHPSVNDYPDVKGITSNVYFITHDVPEDVYKESTSHLNIHEARFLIRLCKHLVLQGYDASKVTILATYKAQMAQLIKERDKIDLLNNVDVKTVDDYQGEENTIILLSLVRSNRDANIGFLRTKNRMCVALSRAREGLYIVGNMENLTRSKSLWIDIQHTLIKQNAFGEQLTLKCEHHPDHITSVSTAKDFDMVPEGGCNLPCSMVLKCDHTCTYMCHVIDMDHNDRYKCVTNCEKVMCCKGHKCKKACWMKCDSKCMHPVQSDLRCGHRHVQPCSEVTATCFSKCLKVQPCGHSCQNNCHYSEPECEACFILVEKTFPQCGHKGMVPCYQDIQKALCKILCSKTLKCGHQCTRYCGEPCGNSNGALLRMDVKSGHTNSVPWSNSLAIGNCQQLCRKILPCKHKCKCLCGEPCTKECTEMGPFRVGSCSHTINIPCYKKDCLDEKSEELLAYCQSPCGMQLYCGHKCKGKCNECLQGRIHKKCTELCGRLLICGHVCEAPCYISCPPCPQKYLYKCVHAEMKRECFRVLQMCTEPCAWRCEHYKCTKICSEVCDRPPCNAPCKKELACGHPCMGFCGDPCPPLCRVCEPFKVAESLGAKKDCRFVYLVDCEHTIQDEELQLKIMEKDAEILMKTCPVCDTAIVNTQRYKNDLKSFVKYACGIKIEIFNQTNAMGYEKKKAIEKLHSIQMGTCNDNYRKTVTFIITNCEQNLAKFCFSGEIVQLGTNILLQMSEEFSNIFKCKDAQLKNKSIAYFEVLLKAVKEHVVNISEQEIKDFQMELVRLQRISLLCRVADTKFIKEGLKESLYSLCCDMALSPKKYLSTEDELIKEFLLNIKQNMNIPEKQIMNPKQIKLVKIKGLCEGSWLKSDVNFSTNLPLVMFKKKKDKNTVRKCRT